MNRKISGYIFLIICILGLFLLFYNINHERGNFTFEIYLSRDTDNSNREEAKKLDETPVVTSKDIKKYYWKDHKIEFTEEFLEKHKSTIGKEDVSFYGGSRILGAKDFDKAIVMVNGKKIYEAGFPYAPHRAFRNTGELVIKDLASGNGIEITVNNKGKNGDTRNNKALYKVLNDLKVLVN